jgi:hypothetical protein
MFLGEPIVRCLFFLYLLSFVSSASSCIQTDEQVAIWSSKYIHLFNVSTQENNSSFSVTVSLPDKINEKMFNSVWVVVGDQDDPLMALPTTVIEEEGKTKAWFIAKPIDAEEYVFLFSYGKSCGVAIEVPVEFKEKT